MAKHHFSDIIDDIENENCVLIIGPDLQDFGDKSFFEMMCEDFLSDEAHTDVLDNPSQYVFLNEELIQLKPGSGNEIKVRNMMKRFYQKQTMLDDPLTKVSQIPFNFIISLMPDHRLTGIFDKQGFPYSFGYYPIEGIKDEVEEKPTKTKPLIYNLLGDFDKKDAIITFDSMFQFLLNVMKNDLPTTVSTVLKKASTFIFLGVHFERWHAQLLLKIITSKGLKYTISKGRGNKDVSLFVSRRLQLDLLDNDPKVFLDHLFDACKEKDNLMKAEGKNFLRILPPSPYDAIVFISYSHHDMPVAEKIASALQKKNIKVILDEMEMHGGQRIEEFMYSKIRDADIVIPVLSENSLSRPFVIKEITIALDLHKPLLPCCLDNSLLDADLVNRHFISADNALGNLGNSIVNRINGKLTDLVTQQSLWIFYKEHFPIVLEQLRSMKCRPIKNLDVVEIEYLVRDIHMMLRK